MDASFNNKTSRKWLLTINNPVELGLTHNVIKEILETIKGIGYWCMSDEIGETGTYHTHLYIFRNSPIRATTLHKKLVGAHRDIAKGTSQEVRDYITKSGKWAVTKKAETSVDGTFEEWGEMPIERPGARNDIADLYGMIKDGLSDYQILEQDADYMIHLEKIENARQVVNQERFRDEVRKVEVVYIWGNTGTGKTRYVAHKYGYRNMYRVIDYSHPFDSYRGQDVLVFEEFRSSLSIGCMLDYMDIHPVELPCRYRNKFASYSKVYIISNLPISQQYRRLQMEDYESYQAFLRRVHEVHHYTGNRVEISKLQNVNGEYRLQFVSEWLHADINPFTQKEEISDAEI